jgi:hypothetical protein
MNLGARQSARQQALPLKRRPESFVHLLNRDDKLPGPSAVVTHTIGARRISLCAGRGTCALELFWRENSHVSQYLGVVLLFVLAFCEISESCEICE